MTSQEEKIRVNARIPKSLYDFVCSEYDNVSQAINEGLENLRESKTSGMSYKADSDIQVSHTSADNIIQEHTDVIHTGHTPVDNVIHPDIQVLTATTEEQKARIEEYKAQVQTLNVEITRLKNTIMEAPDPIELVKLQGRNEGFNLLIEEKNKRIEDLTREVGTLNGFAHYFKNVEVKQIDAPIGEKVKPWWRF
jgi:predicted RNase H-like nuclease (RuvC/YqgF family)